MGSSFEYRVKLIRKSCEAHVKVMGSSFERHGKITFTFRVFIGSSRIHFCRQSDAFMYYSSLGFPEPSALIQSLIETSGGIQDDDVGAEIEKLLVEPHDVTECSTCVGSQSEPSANDPVLHDQSAPSVSDALTEMAAASGDDVITPFGQNVVTLAGELPAQMSQAGNALTPILLENGNIGILQPIIGPGLTLSSGQGTISIPVTPLQCDGTVTGNQLHLSTVTVPTVTLPALPAAVSLNQTNAAQQIIAQINGNATNQLQGLVVTSVDRPIAVKHPNESANQGEVQNILSVDGRHLLAMSDGTLMEYVV